MTPLTCPYCGHVNDMHSDVAIRSNDPSADDPTPAREAKVGDGDASMCIQCSNVSVLKGGVLEVISHAQLIGICTKHPIIIKALLSWLQLQPNVRH